MLPVVTLSLLYLEDLDKLLMKEVTDNHATGQG
jgi:hypothetical protein